MVSKMKFSSPSPLLPAQCARFVAAADVTASFHLGNMGGAYG